MPTLSGCAARRRGLTRPLQHLPAPAGRVRRDSSHPAIHRGNVRTRNPAYYQGEEQAGVRAHPRRPGQGPGTAAAAAQPARRDPARSRLPAAALLRYADDHLLGFIGPKAEAEEIKTSSRRSCVTNSSSNSTRQNADHPRPHPGGPFLGYEITAQHADRKITAGPACGQREDRAARAAGCDQGQTRPLPAPRQTLAPDGHAEPRRLRHRRCLRGRIPGHRPVLPARQRCLAAHRLRWDAQTSMLKTLAAKHRPR